MQKILFVIPTLGNGGAERSLVNLLCELPSWKYEIDLLVFKEKGAFFNQVPDYVNILEQTHRLKKLYSPVKEAGIYSVIKILGAAVSRILARKKGAQKAILWKYFYRPFVEKLEKHYDVAIGYLGGESTDYILDCVQADKIIHWVHNDYRKSGMSKKHDLKVFPKVNAVVTISEECLKILNEEFPKFKDKCFNIANISSSVFIKSRAEEFYPEEYKEVNGVILLSVGRLHEQKGFDMAITASKILKNSELMFQWFIIGSGLLEKRLKEQIRKEDVEDCIHLIGTRENPYPYIKNCDLFIQTSRYEGKSVVLDEAKILAKPIVATAYPTVKDQIVFGREGRIVEMTASGIAKGIIELVNEPETIEAIKKYLSQFDYGNQEEVQKYIHLFSE